jgi:hypothetical protein
MPDFLARFAAGTTLETWSDPPLGDRAGRLNPFIQRPHRYRRAESGALVEIAGVVAGVVGPLDGALGGRLFYGWFAETASGSPPAVTSPPGQSSVRRFTPTAFGHYTYVLRRAGGGGVILHIECEGS